MAPVTINALYGDMFKALTIGASNSRPFTDRLLERFALLADWTTKIGPHLRSQTRSNAALGTTEGRILFKDEPIASVNWTGVGEVALIRDNHSVIDERIKITTGVDAHEIVPSISLLALDAIYDDVRCGNELSSQSTAFDDELRSLLERYKSAGLLPSKNLLDKMLRTL
jgi:hypothetical protein